jgi:hypothetical protein
MLFREVIAACCENLTKIHCVGRLLSFSVLKQVVHTESLSFKELKSN